MGEVEGDNLGFLEVNLHLHGVREIQEVAQLVLEYRHVGGERKSSLFMEIGWPNDS